MVTSSGRVWRKEVGQSVRRRLLGLAKARREDFQLLLTRYGQRTLPVSAGDLATWRALRAQGRDPLHTLDGCAASRHAVRVELPALLDFPAPQLRAYPRETVIAEKLEAMVQLGMANSG